MQNMMQIKIIKVLSGYHIDTGIPPGIQFPKLSKLIFLFVCQAREIFEDDFRSHKYAYRLVKLKKKRLFARHRQVSPRVGMPRTATATLRTGRQSQNVVLVPTQEILSVVPPSELNGYFLPYVYLRVKCNGARQSQSTIGYISQLFFKGQVSFQ